MPTQYTPNSVATMEGFMYQQLNGPFGSNSPCIRAAGASRISFNQAPKLNPEDDFTVECWYRFDDLDFNGSGRAYPVIFYDTSNTFTLAGVSTGSTVTQIVCTIKDHNPTTNVVDTRTITSSANVLSVNTWHHVAVARSINTIKIYVDGAEVASLLTSRPVMLYRLLTFSFGRHDTVGKSGISAYANIRISRSCKYNAPFTRPTSFDYTSDAIVMYQAPYQEAERYVQTLLRGNTSVTEVGDIAIARSTVAGIAMDSSRNIYIADSSFHVIRKIDINNNVTIFAGIPGTTGVLNTSIPTTSTFNTPVAVAVDSLDNIYISDQGNRRIRKITPAGVVSTFSGSGTAGNTNGAAASTTFTTVEGLAIDSSNNVYVADSGGYRIRKITSAGVSTTLAGSTIGYTDSATSTLVKFNGVYRIAVYGTNLFALDFNNNSLRKVSLTNGATTTFDFVVSPRSVCVNTSYGVMFVGKENKIQMYDLFNDGADFTTPTLVAANPTNTTDDQDGPLYSAKINTVTDIIVDRNNTDTIYIANNIGTNVGLRKIYKKTNPLVTQGKTELSLPGDGLHNNNNNNIVNKSTGYTSLPFQFAAGISNSSPFGTNANTTLSFSGGANEYLNYLGGPETTLTTGNFTIEFWYQSSATQAYGKRIMTFGSTNNGNSLQLVQGNSSATNNFISLFAGTGASFWVNNTTKNVSDGLWHHIAITRIENSLRLYIDGSQIGSTYTSAINLVNSATQGLWLAATATTATTSTACNISNFRLIKGIALYTEPTYTVPTSPLTWVEGTSILLFNDYLTDKVLTKTNTQTVSNTPFTNSAETTSLLLNGIDSAINTNVADSSFNFTTEAFTIEGWFKLSSANASDNIGLISCMNNESASTLRGWVVNYDNLNKIIEFKSFQKGVAVATVSSSTINLANDTWFHVAVAQQGGVTTTHRIRIFINGVLSATSSSAIALLGNSPYRLSLGEWDMNISGRRRMSGNISNVRVVRNVCLYTATFTPSTTSRLNIYNANLISTSFLYRSPYDTSYVYSVWGSKATLSSTNYSQSLINPYSTTANCGSIYVDSTSQAVTGPSDFLQLGTSSFTIEFWIKPMLQPNSSRSFTILGHETTPTDPSRTYWRIAVADYYYDTLKGLTFAVTDNTYYTSALNTGKYLTANKWCHVVFQRNGTTWSAYIDGVLQTLTARSDYSTWSNSVDLNMNLSAGGYIGSASPVPYYLSDVRVVKGIALYSGATITVPTTPLTTITTAPTTTVARTLLLLSFTDGKISDLSKEHSIVTNSGVSVSDIQGKDGTSSLYFNGVNGLLQVPSMRSFNFGAEDFTVEFWILPLAYGTGNVGAQIFGTTNGSQTGYSINLGQDINSFRIISNAVNYNTLAATGTWGDTLTVSANGGPPLNVWTHMAIVKNNNNLTIYKNGVSVATTSSALNWYFAGTNAIIGKFNDGITTRNFNGYIDMLKVTSNRAVYTAAFIPPARNSAAF